MSSLDTDAGMIEVSLKRWNPRTMMSDRRAIAVGRPGVGKSVLSTDIMYHMSRRFEDGIVMAPTDKFTGLWESFAPPVSVFHSWDKSAVKRIIDRQEEIFNATYRAKLLEARENGKPRPIKADVVISPVYIVADDCMAANAMSKDPHINEIYMNGRHLRIFLLTTVQWLMDMPINKRQLTDYLFVCSEDSPPALHRLYDYFFSQYIPSYQAFVDIMDQITVDFGVLVLDRTNQKSRRLEDHVFWYRAKPHAPGSFRIGSEEVWHHSKEQYFDRFQRPGLKEKYFDSRRRRPRIHVNQLDDMKEE